MPPKERFRAIGGIIGIDSLDELELVMMRVRDRLDSEVRTEITEIKALYGVLSNLLNAEINQVSEVIAPLNKFLIDSGMSGISNLDDVFHLGEEILKAAKIKDFDLNNAIQNISARARRSQVPKEVVALFYDLDGRMSRLLERHDNKELGISDLLRIGGEIISHEELDQCPLCEQPIERHAVLNSISRRSLTLAGLSDEASRIRQDCVPLMRLLDNIKNDCQEISSEIMAFQDMSNEIAQLEAIIGKLVAVKDVVEQFKDLRTGMHAEEFEKLSHNINHVMKDILRKSNERFKESSLNENEHRALTALSLIEQVKPIFQDILVKESELKKTQKHFSIADAIYISFTDAKKARIQEVFDTIQHDVKKFYLMLHPTEPHSNIELQVVTGRRASAGIKIESFGKIEDPRAFTSEGHLDSLGLCIFLAFVKEFNKSCPLVILDDVVTTIDAEHRGMICKLLMENFTEEQLIITTHDEMWFEQLRSHQRAYGLDGEFENLVIKRWEVNSGPSIIPYKPRWSNIKDLISLGEKDNAGNEGRKYLEFVLETICSSTRALVPYNKLDRLDIGDLFPAAKNRIKKLLREGIFKNGLVDAFEKVESEMIMGNILSHNNPLSGTVTLAEVKDFCESVNNLNEMFLCPNCHCSVEYQQGLDVIVCSNARCNTPFRERTN